ncbi:TetR family transcriptional regulator [Rhodococcus hoagii]|nr:TetR family transcriptional regulator [Prescottella equi]
MSGYKERALLDGAQRVFARDGYSRASIQSLATEASVSTRTIYNRYCSKEALFRAVILDNANRVAECEIALADQLLGRITDLRRDLIAFGVAWATPDPASQSHFAMIRQVSADADHIEPDVLAAWRHAGPERVRSAIAEHLLAMRRQRLLKVKDGQIAAVHLIQLTAGTVTSIASTTGIEHLVTEGVDVFLAACGR